MVSLDSQIDLQAFTELQLAKYKLPALSIATWQGGRVRQAAAGIANLATGVEATADTVFQIGSITKVMTTCLVMQLVDEGRIDLDNPVKHYLRDFQVADPKTTAYITVRELLNHTSGIAGDFFPDDNGHEGNLIARYVDRCTLLPQVHPRGDRYSYCNSAFVIAGRIVEVVRGISWYQAMQDFIFTPLGMDHAFADPKELIRYRAAMGHLQDHNSINGWSLPDEPWLPMGMAPCGATPTMTAVDLITFARAHLDQGKNQFGEAWLSSDAVRSMQRLHISFPKVSHCIESHSGLGWVLKDYSENDLRTFGHNGATNGFYAALRVIPTQDAAYAVLMNGVHPAALLSTQQALLQLLTGVAVKEPDIDKTTQLTEEHRSIAGHYESFDKVIKVIAEENYLRAHLVYKNDSLPAEDLILYPLGEGCFGAENAKGTRRPNLAFVGSGVLGKPDYLFDGSRLNPRRDFV